MRATTRSTSCALAATLRGEVDEIHLEPNPVVIGAGAPLLDGDFQIDRYELTSTRPSAAASSC